MWPSLVLIAPDTPPDGLKGLMRELGANQLTLVAMMRARSVLSEFVVSTSTS